MSEIERSEIERKIALAEDIIEYRFHDRTLLENALTHPSALEDGGPEVSYERLEFLGDSLVGAIIAIEVFERFPELDEGGMTRIKVSLVSGSTLSRISKELGLASAIIFGASETGTGKRGLHSALENIYESITAALFLDGGIDAARAWVQRTLMPYISKELAFEPESPKSTLQEILQEHQVTPTYETIDVSGPPHDRTFTSAVLADGNLMGQGVGHSKKEAEAAAALDALNRMK